MIAHAADDDEPAVTDDDRRRWLDQLPRTLAGPFCPCGECPTIELEVDGRAAPVDGPRRVLMASAPGALLLLFVDDGRLSSLELAPVDPDTAILEFPPVEQIEFAAS